LADISRENALSLMKEHNEELGKEELNQSTELTGETPGFWLGISNTRRYTVQKSNGTVDSHETN